MKKLLIVIAMLFIFINLLKAQSRISFGAYFGPSLPIGNISNEQELGGTIGAAVFIPIGFKSNLLVAGANLNWLLGKTVYMGEGMNEWIEYEDWEMTSFFIGAKYGKEKGFYFLPAVALNDVNNDKRIGVDLGCGFILPIRIFKIKLFLLDFNTKFRMTNLIGQEKNEKMVNLIQFVAGIII